MGREWGEDGERIRGRPRSEGETMPVIWKNTKWPGIRYYEHPTRKHGVGRDRYFTIRYQRDGQRVEEGIGWASELDPKDKKHWTAEKAAVLLAELKEAAKGLKRGPSRLKERRDIDRNQKVEAEAERQRLEREAVTFGSFFTETYLPQAKIDKKERSATREEGLYKVWILDVLGHLPMKDVSPFHLEKLKKKMAEGNQSPRSIEYAFAVIRQVFNTAGRVGVFSGENPIKKVKIPKPDNNRMRFLTHAEADALLAALKAKSADVHDMTLLSLYAGLRFGEIASLTWQDVDLDKGVLTIRDAKAGSRYAFLTEQAAEMFRTRKQGKPSDYVFSKRSDRGMDKTPQKLTKISHSFYRAVDELKLNEGIDDPRQQICFHSCRHTYASWLIEEGADLYTVQKLLGHKTNVMTQRYAHLSDNRLRDAVKALEQAKTITTVDDADEGADSSPIPESQSA
ncbi:MAG TPA: tyrosine-type recombinase/integrase [Syntrophales bacterium]|nr:tyrosine-type recombinase/integrase [Syntrophales bacterium]